MKNVKILVVSLAMILAGSLTMRAQEKDPAVIKEIVESKNYVFKAQRVYPQNGTTRHLTPEYDLTVRIDSVISYLPYFGRAYSAPINPSDGGIKFTSDDFNYTVEKSKKAWDITIKPKDVSDVQQLSLAIYDNGSATLRIISTNRQYISFDGYIEKGKPKEKKAF